MKSKPVFANTHKLITKQHGVVASKTILLICTRGIKHMIHVQSLKVKGKPSE
jgi:hypothetical protein